MISPIPLTPEAWIKSTTSQILRLYPTLSLPQLLIWVEEAYLLGRDRELGPETYDPLADFPQENPLPPENQDQPSSAG